MLTIGKLRDPNYYLAQVADGLEEYYTNAKEAPGVWMGRSAERLGLSGEVDGEVLHRVLDHRDPNTGTRLTRAQGAPKVPGFDATFCAPKSVSLLFALGDPEVSNEVRNAHDAAVSTAVRALEDFAARSRRGKGGAERLVAEGFVAAAFRHRTSRAGDPHLHTHVVAANLVFSPQDQRWSALDARPLYGWAKTVGYLYEAKLRDELTRRLGVEWTPVRRGIADINGIPRKTLRAFSRRRVEIEAHMAERGETTARAAQVATYATRKPKDRSIEADGLLPEWRERARSLGLGDDALADLVGRVRPSLVPEPGTTAAEALFAALAAPDGLTAEVSTFGRKEVLQAICDRLPAGADIGQVVALAREFVASGHVVSIGVPDRLWTNDILLELDGTVVPAHRDLLRWTTSDMLATESRLLDGAISRADDWVGIAGSDDVTAAVSARRPTLSAEQTAMIERLCGSGAGVEVVVGVAGSGKTFALAAARDAWETSGYRVFGVALSARAAAELQDGSGIHSTTLARLLADLDRPDAGGLAAHSVLVVDEAAMIGTRPLARLLDHARTDGAKVVLVGDHRQLPEIDAGGAFAGLAVCLDAVELTENRRQREGWERDALAELRHGNPDDALAAYQVHDRVHQADTADEIRDQLVDDWWAARQPGGRHLMVAARHRDVDDLNHRARQRLSAAGVLGDDVAIGERCFAVGDEILATRNDYRIMIFNGTRATITRIDEESRRIEAVDVGRRPLVIPFAYAEAGHLTWGYATTLHKAQGATLDQTFVLADETLRRERGYSGMSRGTEANDLYVTAPDHEEHHGAPDVDDLIDMVRQTVNRSDAKTLALQDFLSTRPPARNPIDALRAERLRLAPIVNQAPRAPFDDLRVLERDQQRAFANLAQARQKRQAAEEALGNLGGHRRLTRRHDRQHAEQRLDRAVGAEAWAETSLEFIGERRKRLDEELTDWKAWTAEHGHEAHRLRTVDSLLAEHHRQHQPTLEQHLGVRDAGRDVGIELGL